VVNINPYVLKYTHTSSIGGTPHNRNDIQRVVFNSIISLDACPCMGNVSAEAYTGHFFARSVLG
jgi:hypothetical protein